MGVVCLLSDLGTIGDGLNRWKIYRRLYSCIEYIYPLYTASFGSFLLAGVSQPSTYCTALRSPKWACLTAWPEQPAAGHLPLPLTVSGLSDTPVYLSGGSRLSRSLSRTTVCGQLWILALMSAEL